MFDLLFLLRSFVESLLFIGRVWEESLPLAVGDHSNIPNTLSPKSWITTLPMLFFHRHQVLTATTTFLVDFLSTCILVCVSSLCTTSISKRPLVCYVHERSRITSSSTSPRRRIVIPSESLSCSDPTVLMNSGEYSSITAAAPIVKKIMIDGLSVAGPRSCEPIRNNHSSPVVLFIINQQCPYHFTRPSITKGRHRDEGQVDRLKEYIFLFKKSYLAFGMVIIWVSQNCNPHSICSLPSLPRPISRNRRVPASKQTVHGSD